MSTHSSTRPFAPLPADRVTQSVVRCRERIPRPRQSRRRFCALSVMPILVFVLVSPVIQSTIVLLSPLISSVSSSPGTNVPRSKGGRSQGFIVVAGPMDSFFLSTGCFIDSSKFRMTFSFWGRVCVISSFQSFPSPSVCPTEPLCCETQLCASIFEHCSGSMPHEDRLLHHAVVLHPKSERRANITGTSPSYTAHVTIVQILLAFFRQQWQAHLPPAKPHEPRSSDFVGYPGFIQHSARSEGEAQTLGLPRTHLVDHGSTPRPIDAAVQSCAVHMTVDLFELGRHGESLGTVDAHVTPPTSQGLAHTALGTLKPIPIAMETVSQYIKDFALHVKSSCPHSHTCLSTSAMPAWAPCPGPTTPSQYIHCRAALRRIIPAFGSPRLLRFPKHVFGNAPPQHRCLHSTLADAMRVPKFCHTVLQARGPSDVLHLCQQSGRQASVDTRQGEYLRNHSARPTLVTPATQVSEESS